MKYKLFQIKNIESCPYSFGGFSSAQKNNFSLNDYEVVYEGNIDPVTFDEESKQDINYILEYLFTIFNFKYPTDFVGRSMSTSDVIELDGKYYYTDHFGFKKITDMVS